jgi:hypothetical protein
VVTLNNDELPVTPGIGNVTITIEGANSVGSAPVAKTGVNVAVATDYPWAQIDQNSNRVNSIEISNSSNVAIWHCSATTWQYTQVEDDR